MDGNGPVVVVGGMGMEGERWGEVRGVRGWG